jgi:hypothetical protein
LPTPALRAWRIIIAAVVSWRFAFITGIIALVFVIDATGAP